MSPTSSQQTEVWPRRRKRQLKVDPNLSWARMTFGLLKSKGPTAASASFVHSIFASNSCHGT